MLSCRVIEAPQADLLAGDFAQWTLANDGTVPWPSGTTFRLVAGPMLLCPLVEVPAATPGQTVTVQLEVQPTEKPEDVFYSLVTQDYQPFGEIAHAKVATKPPAAPKPVCAMVTSPMDGVEGGLEADQGEVKWVEWMLANPGPVPWPEDVIATLIYNTPGFDHLPASVGVPAIAPGMTVHVGFGALMPEKEGLWKAIWAVASPSQPDFGDVLVAEFSVSDFPFVDWTLALEAKADTVSEASSHLPEGEHRAAPKSLSAAFVSQNHVFPAAGKVECGEAVADANGIVSLGQVSHVPAGEPWLLELSLCNDGEEPWPADVALACCFGSGLGCDFVSLGDGEPVQAGETILVQLDLFAPAEPSRTAWVVASGQKCFGPTMLLEVL